jgi:hypothetical protein
MPRFHLYYMSALKSWWIGRRNRRDPPAQSLRRDRRPGVAGPFQRPAVEGIVACATLIGSRGKEILRRFAR